MRQFFFVVGLVFVGYIPAGFCQSPSEKKQDFFNDTSVLHCTLVTNLSKLLGSRREKGDELTGNFIISMADDTRISEQVSLEISGNFRREFCFVPPVRIKFSNAKKSYFFPLKQMKLVSSCRTSEGFNQYLLKEYLIYKIYNLLTDRSYRVRLIELTLKDSIGKRNSITEFAFLQEDIKNVARRNDCRIWDKGKISSESADHHQMTLISIFEFMIGNTDWAVIADHNIKLILPASDSSGKPFPVPFDFDYSGLVNTYYAVPDERLEFKTVKERQYLGFPRPYIEIENELNLFREKKPEIFALINHCERLTLKNREEMTEYLNEFYKIISNPGMVKYNFIDKAKSQ